MHGQNINLPVRTSMCVCPSHFLSTRLQVRSTPRRIFTVDSLKDVESSFFDTNFHTIRPRVTSTASESKNADFRPTNCYISETIEDGHLITIWLYSYNGKLIRGRI